MVDETVLAHKEGEIVALSAKVEKLEKKRQILVLATTSCVCILLAMMFS